MLAKKREVFSKHQLILALQRDTSLLNNINLTYAEILLQAESEDIPNLCFDPVQWMPFSCSETLTTLAAYLT